MLLRPRTIRPLVSLSNTPSPNPHSLPSSAHSPSSPPAHQQRPLHHRTLAPPIPKPTPFVPNASTFLSLIGRNLAQYSSKIESWNKLFTLSSRELKDLGVEPPRARRYLIRWRERFRRGVYGVGGDARFVSKEGVVGLRVLGTEGGRVVVNVKSLDGQGQEGGLTAEGRDAGGNGELVKLKGVKVEGARTITGRNVLPTGVGEAVIQVKEGLWEERRGRKIDRGERRRDEVRAKRRGEERKNAK